MGRHELPLLVGSQTSPVAVDGMYAYLLMRDQVATRALTIADISDPSHMHTLVRYSAPTKVAIGVAGDTLLLGDVGGLVQAPSPVDGFTFLVEWATGVGGSQLSYDVLWNDAFPGMSPIVTCGVTGGSCTVDDVDLGASTATVLWTLPTVPGTHELAVNVIHSSGYQSRFTRVQVQ